MTQDHTRPDHATEEAEDADAHLEHAADREPTEEEERAAEKGDLDPEVAQHYREATRTGAEVKGEGEIS